MLKPKSSILDLTTLMPAFEDQYKNTTDRQALEEKVTTRNVGIAEKSAREAKVVADQARQSADTTRTQQDEILGGIEKELAKANKAIALADSQNPIDRMTLYMLQQTDPGYTRDGNIRRMEYYQTAANAVGGIEVLKQAGYSDQISQIQSDMEAASMEDAGELTLLKMKEAQGEERIKIASDYMANMSGMIQNRQTMQETALAQLPDEAIPAAVEEAKKSESKSVNIGGIDMPLSLLENRQKAADDRKFLIATRSNEMATLKLGSMTMEMVDEAVQVATKNGGQFIADDGTIIPLARLSERRAALTNQEYAQSLQVEGLKEVDRTRVRMVNDKLLETFDTTTLGKMLATDSKWNGMQFDRDQVEAKFNSKKQAELQNLPGQILQMQGDIPERTAVEFDQYLTSLKVRPGSQAEVLIRRSSDFNKVTAAMMADPETDNDTKLTLLDMTAKSRENVDAAVKQEALIQAGGDKDIAIIKEAAIRGTTVDADVLEAMIAERAGKANKSLAGILTPEMNAAFQGAFNLTMQTLEMDPTTMGMGIEEKRQRAVFAGMEELRIQASGGLTEQLLAMQTRAPGNPLQKTGIDPARFIQMAAAAERSANEKYQRTMNLSDEEMKKRREGRVGDGELLRAQQAEMLMELEKLRPGLAKEYTDWWSSEGRDKLTENFINAKTVTPKTSQELTQWSIAAPMVTQQAGTYAQTLNDGYSYMFEVELKKQHQDFITFQGKPESKQAFLLDNTPGLTDSEKKIGWAALQPLIQSAKDAGYNQEQATTFIEGRLRSLEVANPEGQKVIKKMIAGRDAALKIVDSFAKSSNVARNVPFAQTGMDLSNMFRGAPVDRTASGYDWMKE